MRQRVWQGVDPGLHAAADQVGHHRRAAVIRHVHHVDAGFELEQLPGEMADRAGAERGHIDLAGIGFDMRNELGDGFHRQRWRHFHDEGQLGKPRDRREVAQEIERERGLDARIDGIGGGDKEERVAVGW